jgi:serine/threonine-protein kinase RsbW
MNDNNPRLTATYFLALGNEAIREALTRAESYCEQAKCGENARAKLAIIVEEIVANIVEHGNCPAQTQIELSFARVAGEIVVTFVDEGERFDPRTSDAPGDLPPDRGGGAGIALVKAWTSALDWDYKDGRNHLRLVIADHGD